MNTVEKGDKFEDRVFSMITDWITEGRIPFQIDHCEIFQKRKYFSRDREDNITMDISIEVTMPGGEYPSLYGIVECKDYKSQITVDELEEFDSKLQQITGRNVKGIFVTSSTLQTGALNYARSRGIAVIRLMPDDKVDQWLYFGGDQNSSGTLHSTELNNALLNPYFKSKGRRFYALDVSRMYDDFDFFFTRLFATMYE